MLTPLGNYHHSILPEPGALGYITNGTERYTGKPLYWQGKKRLCQAVSYRLTDSPDYRYSVGIHTVEVEFLDNRERARFSGFYFTPKD